MSYNLIRLYSEINGKLSLIYIRGLVRLLCIDRKIIDIKRIDTTSLLQYNPNVIVSILPIIRRKDIVSILYDALQYCDDENVIRSIVIHIGDNDGMLSRHIGGAIAIGINYNSFDVVSNVFHSARTKEELTRDYSNAIMYAIKNRLSRIDELIIRYRQAHSQCPSRQLPIENIGFQYFEMSIQCRNIAAIKLFILYVDDRFRNNIIEKYSHENDSIRMLMSKE